MTRTFLNDSLLSNDVYKSNNTSGGNIEGFIRVKVEEYKSPTTVQTGSNFAAQMYQRSDGNYTISYRGTVSHTQPGDIAQNREAILKGQWTPEMQQAVKFTLLAIQQVADQKGISFREAARLFTVTGHSQGGFEAEVMSKLYGLPGSSIDGPGAARLIESEGYRKAVAWVRSQEPDANLNGPMPEFWARQYTVTVGGLNSHIAGVKDSPAGIRLTIARFFTLRLRSGASRVVSPEKVHKPSTRLRAVLALLAQADRASFLSSSGSQRSCRFCCEASGRAYGWRKLKSQAASEPQVGRRRAHGYAACVLG